jgi:orotidine-5'-phosphate decarboxylase
VHDSKKIIVALDYDNLDLVIDFVDSIDPELCRIKIGKELFTKYGPSIVNNIHEKGFEIFLDLKFHDIPTTVYKACISAFSLNIWMLNIHLSGGYDMAISYPPDR